MDGAEIVQTADTVDLTQVIQSLNSINDNLIVNNTLQCFIVGFLFAFAFFAWTFMRRG